MSTKPARKKKRTPPATGTPPTTGAPSATGVRGAGRAQPGVGTSAARGLQSGVGTPAPTDDGEATNGAAPLKAFRAPTINTPSQALLAPRTNGAGSQVGGGEGVPRGVVLQAAASRPAAAHVQPATVSARTGEPPAVTSRLGGASAGSATAVAAPLPPANPARAPFLAGEMPDGPVQVMSWNCSQIDGVEPHGLGMTYWFDAAPSGDPYPVSVRFTGRRLSGDGAAGPRDSFETVRTIQQVVPGSGRVAMTTRVPGVAPGTWEVTATPVIPRAVDGSATQPAPPVPMPRGLSTGTTAYLPVVNVRAPGVRIGAWPALVTLGFMAAIGLQWALGAQRDLPVGRVLVVSLIASFIGLVGAKVYYLATHRAEKARPLTAGMSVQGFVVAAVPVLVVGGWSAGIPVGPMLDVSAPGLLVGMTIGRLGCFLGGCCVGLPTASRWGIWSSDRGVGVRRIPVQLFESAMAGTIAAVASLAVLVLDPAVDGLLFLAGVSAYTFGRQLLFPLRGIPRKTANGRIMTMLITGLVLMASVVALVVG